LESGPTRLALEHPELVAQHQDLEVLRATVGPTSGEQARQRSDDEEQEEEHRGM
jgi:hypothetical protein